MTEKLDEKGKSWKLITDFYLWWKQFQKFHHVQTFLAVLEE